MRMVKAYTKGDKTNQTDIKMKRAGPCKNQQWIEVEGGVEKEGTQAVLNLGGC